MKKTLLIAPIALALAASSVVVNAQTIVMKKQVPVTPVSTTPITSQPEGELVDNVRRDGFSMFNSTFGTDSIRHTFSTGKYIKGKDGNVYVYSPFFKKHTRSYLKLEPFKGDTLVAHTPQAIYEDYYEEVVDYATRLELVSNSQGSEYEVVADKNGKAKTDIFFTLKGDTLKQVSEGIDPISNLPRVVLGYTEENGAWKWYAESEMIFFPMKEQKTLLDATIDKEKDLEKFEISYISDNNAALSFLVNGVIKGNEVFIHNPYHQDEEHWIKGTIEGNKATFKQQYLGADTRRLSHVFFAPATFTKKADSQTGEESSVYSLTQEIVFNYDAATQTFEAPQNMAFLINSGNVKPSIIASYDVPKVSKYVDKAATPKAVVIKEASPYEDPVGGAVHFVIESKDVNGEYILPQKLFYRIYLNHSNTPMVFKKDKYVRLKADITDMMSIATNYRDIEINGNGRIVWIYEPNFTSVGVQTVYKGGGEERVSDIVWFELNNSSTTGIGALEQSNNVLSVKFFNLQGQQVESPQRGTFIKETTLKNGTKKVSKIVF